jgi:hypothetical protein
LLSVVASERGKLRLVRRYFGQNYSHKFRIDALGKTASVHRYTTAQHVGTVVRHEDVI